jgi:hypothetical protein
MLSLRDGGMTLRPERHLGAKFHDVVVIVKNVGFLEFQEAVLLEQEQREEVHCR